MKVIERDRVYFLLKDLIAVPIQLHLVHCNQTNHGGWWSMIAFRLACLHITQLFFPLRTPAVAARLWIHGDGVQTEGLRSICYTLRNHDCVASDHSGWTLIRSLIHVHLSWMIGCIYLASQKKTFFFGCTPLPSRSHPLYLRVCAFHSAITSCFHLVSFRNNLSWKTQDLRQGDSIPAVVATC